MKTKTIRDLVPTDVPDILEMYREAFRGYPWFEQLSPETVKERWTSNSLQPDFRCIVVSLDDKQVAGAAWWNSMDQDLLRQERGEELATFATENFPGWPLIWEREVMVFPAFQGKG
ncbi:MAG: hypothetical protein NTY66_00055, partial [Candidatus Vogelbacteria bacterium]|nr:hypothetical protein [Candidatus Vogelbacteria bacterium]